MLVFVRVIDSDTMVFSTQQARSLACEALVKKKLNLCQLVLRPRLPQVQATAKFDLLSMQIIIFTFLETS